MCSRREAEKVINERNLKQRVLTEAENFDSRFAYCVDDDVFCDTDISYSDYIKKRYICFTRWGNGKITAGIAIEGHTPLSQKVSDEHTIVIKEV